MDTLERLAASLRPLVRRVRTDATAVKLADGSRWTRQPLTQDRLIAHVAGKKPRGVCPIKAGENVTSVALLDLDDHNGDSGWDDMVNACGVICDAIEGAGGKPVTWRSSGGHGIHIYLLWKEPQDAYSVRQWLFGILDSVGFKNGCKGVIEKQVEVFPKQDSVDASHADENGEMVHSYGSQFILPLAGESVPLEPLLDYTPRDHNAALQVKWRASAPVPVVEKPEAPEPKPIAGADLKELQAALNAIPNEDGKELDYDEWRTVIFGVHAATEGSPEGLQLAHRFSQRSSKYDPKFLDERVWPYIKRKAGGVTAGSIYAMARDMGGYTLTRSVMDPDEFDEIPNDHKQECSVMIEKIHACSDPHALLDSIAPKAGKIGIGSVAVFNLLAGAIKTRFHDLTDSSISPTEVKRAMRPKVTSKALAAKRRSMTEFGNAERMLDKFGDGLMYVPEISQWYLWTGNCWKPAANEHVLHCAQETVRELPEEMKNCQTDEEREAFFKFCSSSQKAAMVDNMVRLAACNPRVLVPIDRLDSNDHLLGVGNGAVDLRTGRLRRPDPEDLITITTDVEYRPDAECPLFLSTLRAAMFDDEEMVSFIQRLLGYTLLGQPNEDILIIPYGQGANGKSTIFGAVQRALGRHAKTAQAESFTATGIGASNAGGAREDILRLRGSRYVYVSEPEQGAELRESVVKSLTGGDVILARGMYAKNSVEIIPSWVSIMPTNHLPIIKGSDFAIWRRIMAIPFNRNFKEDLILPWIPDMKDRVKKEEEAQGVLAWLVQGALSYKKRGLAAPAGVRAARENYQKDMDLMSEWLEDCCVIDNNQVTASAHLWHSWKVYAERHGMLGYIRSSKALGRRLGEKFEADRTTTGARGWRGIKLRDDMFEEV